MFMWSLGPLVPGSFRLPGARTRADRRVAARFLEELAQRKWHAIERQQLCTSIAEGPFLEECLKYNTDRNNKTAANRWLGARSASGTWVLTSAFFLGVGSGSCSNMLGASDTWDVDLMTWTSKGSSGAPQVSKFWRSQNSEGVKTDLSFFFDGVHMQLVYYTM